ncbi:hypothetical protein BGZ91_009046, partial [Linnemannia elongata]
MKILSLLVATTLVVASCVEALPQPILDADADWAIEAERQAAEVETEYEFFDGAVMSSAPVPSWTWNPKPPKTTTV